MRRPVQGVSDFGNHIRRDTRIRVRAGALYSFRWYNDDRKRTHNPDVSVAIVHDALEIREPLGKETRRKQLLNASKELDLRASLIAILSAIDSDRMMRSYCIT